MQAHDFELRRRGPAPARRDAAPSVHIHALLQDHEAGAREETPAAVALCRFHLHRERQCRPGHHPPGDRFSNRSAAQPVPQGSLEAEPPAGPPPAPGQRGDRLGLTQRLRNICFVLARVVAISERSWISTGTPVCSPPVTPRTALRALPRPQALASMSLVSTARSFSRDRSAAGSHDRAATAPRQQAEAPLDRGPCDLQFTAPIFVVDEGDNLRRLPSFDWGP